MSGSPDAAPTPARALGADTRPKIEVGARVRVEGTIRAWSDNGTAFGSSSRPQFIFDRDVSVEVLTPPAPTYKAGDVVAVDYPGSSPVSETYAMVASGKWISLAVHNCSPFTLGPGGFDRWPHRLIARDGKPVTP